MASICSTNYATNMQYRIRTAASGLSLKMKCKWMPCKKSTILLDQLTYPFASFLPMKPNDANQMFERKQAPLKVPPRVSWTAILICSSYMARSRILVEFVLSNLPSRMSSPSTMELVDGRLGHGLQVKKRRRALRLRL